MNLQFEAVLAGRLQVAARLLNRKDILLAEDIGELGQLLLRHKGKHLTDVEVDKLVFASFPLGRRRMRTHKRGNDVHRVFAVEAAHHTELLQFGLPVEPVAALSFDGRDAEAYHRVEPLAACFEQLLLRRFARSPCGVDDTSSAIHDVHVAVAAHAPREFLFTIAAEHKVGMRIDKTGQQRFTRAVEDFILRLVDGNRFARFQHVRNDPVRHNDRPMLDDMQFRHLLSAFRDKSAACNDLRRVFYNQVVHWIRLKYVYHQSEQVLSFEAFTP